MNNFGVAMKSVIASLSKDEKKEIINNSIAFKKRIRKGSSYFVVGLYGEKPSEPYKEILKKYTNNKRKVNIIYVGNKFESQHYVCDYFWSGKIVVKKEKIAIKIYNAMMELYNASREWQEQHKWGMSIYY